MEYRWEDIELIYLLVIGKAYIQEPVTGEKDCLGLLTKKEFTDKTVETRFCWRTSKPLCIGRFKAYGDLYFNHANSEATTADHDIRKNVAAVLTVLATEAVDLTEGAVYNWKFSVKGTTLSSYREDMVTPKLSVTDTSFAEGKYGITVSEFAWWMQIDGYLKKPASSLPKPVRYFEMPIIGDGTPDDPFRVPIPTDIAWNWKLAPRAKRKYDILRKHGFTDDEILDLAPEVRLARINRLAITWSANIPTDSKTGKPIYASAVTAFYSSSPPYVKPLLSRIAEVKKLAIRELSYDEAVELAIKRDPKLPKEDAKSWLSPSP